MRKWIVAALPVVAAMGLMVGYSTARAQDKPAATGKGTVSGVVMKDGKPVEKVQVRLVKPMAGGPGGPGGPGGDRPPGDQPPPNNQMQPSGDQPGGKPGGDQPNGGRRGGGDRPGGANRPKPVAEATTDAEGKFTMADVPAGEYMVVATMRGTGNAREGGREKVTVEDGKTATVTINLQAMPARGGGGGRGGNGGNGNGDRPTPPPGN